MLVSKFSENLCPIESVSEKKCFHRNDVGSLKLTVLIYVVGFKGYCLGLK